MRLDELRRMSKLLAEATGPADVFMSLRDRSLQGPALEKALGKELQRLQGAANPERFMGNPPAQDLAREIVARLGELHRGALATLAVSSEPGAPGEPAPVVASAPEPAPAWPPYHEPAPPSSTPELVVGANHYVLDGPRMTGDLATVRGGRCVAGPRSGAEIAAKVALASGDNGFILAEIDALRLLQRGEGAQRGQVPEVLDLFFGPGGEAGVVLPWVAGIDGATLRERFSGAVPPEHVIWIGRRLLSVVGYAHKLGVLHANIEPAHIIVRPHDHHVTLIDWCWSIMEPSRTRQGFRVYNPEYSAPEVAEKKPPIPPADMYAVGRCMLFLAGGDLASGAMPEGVPDRLQRFIRYLTRESPLQRAQDAWEMFHELERVRAAVYGEHRFLELVVP